MYVCGQVAKSGLKVAKCQTLVLVDIKVGFEIRLLFFSQSKIELAEAHHSFCDSRNCNGRVVFLRGSI